jgi:hypothetical protein
LFFLPSWHLSPFICFKILYVAMRKHRKAIGLKSNSIHRTRHVTEIHDKTQTAFVFRTNDTVVARRHSLAIAAARIALQSVFIFGESKLLRQQRITAVSFVSPSPFAPKSRSVERSHVNTSSKHQRTKYESFHLPCFFLGVPNRVTEKFFAPTTGNLPSPHG